MALGPLTAVLVLSTLVQNTPYAEESYWLLHVLGGGAVALLFHRNLQCIGVLRPAPGYVVTFALACSTALAWELAEFAMDQVAGTGLQKGNLDTMSDLSLSVSGAAFYLACCALARHFAELRPA